MNNKLEWIWETFSTDNYSCRVKVIGGWIVRIENYHGDAITSCFVPDKNHDWEIIDSNHGQDNIIPVPKL